MNTLTSSGWGAAGWCELGQSALNRTSIISLRIEKCQRLKNAVRAESWRYKVWMRANDGVGERVWAANMKLVQYVEGRIFIEPKVDLDWPFYLCNRIIKVSCEIYTQHQIQNLLVWRGWNNQFHFWLLFLYYPLYFTLIKGLRRFRNFEIRIIIWIFIELHFTSITLKIQLFSMKF